MTPLTDQAAKTDLIEHLNLDHAAELLTLARAYGRPAAEYARLADIVAEGCLLDTGGDKPLFVAFSIAGEVEEQVLYLAYDALARQGKPLFGKVKQYFTFVRSEHLTPNLLRLYFQTAAPVADEAGYALCFHLKKLRALPPQTHSGTDRISVFAKWFNRLFLKYLKHISPQKRQAVFAGMAKDKRYYTVRGQRDGLMMVDVYLHGDTPGSHWARVLQAGDMVMSMHDYREHTAHLHQGRALLLCDETSVPTVAAILEQWRNPEPPVIVYLTHDPQEQAYLPDSALPSGSLIRRLHYRNHTAPDLAAALAALPDIDCAWGALENAAAKTARHHLREVCGLRAENNRVKAYWRAEAAKAAA